MRGWELTLDLGFEMSWVEDSLGIWEQFRDGCLTVTAQVDLCYRDLNLIDAVGFDN